MKQTVHQSFDGTHTITTIENHHEAAPCTCIGLGVALVIVAGWLAALTLCRWQGRR